MTKCRGCVIIYSVEPDAELCNGSTADSDSVCWGSNPYSAAIKNAAVNTNTCINGCFIFAFISFLRKSKKAFLLYKALDIFCCKMRDTHVLKEMKLYD